MHEVYLRISQETTFLSNGFKKELGMTLSNHNNLAMRGNVDRDQTMKLIRDKLDMISLIIDPELSTLAYQKEFERKVAKRKLLAMRVLNLEDSVQEQGNNYPQQNWYRQEDQGKAEREVRQMSPLNQRTPYVRRLAESQSKAIIQTNTTRNSR